MLTRAVSLAGSLRLCQSQTSHAVLVRNFQVSARHFVPASELLDVERYPRPLTKEQDTQLRSEILPAKKKKGPVNQRFAQAAARAQAASERLDILAAKQDVLSQLDKVRPENATAHEGALALDDAQYFQQTYDRMTYEHLPPREEWRQKVRAAQEFGQAHRYFVANRATVQRFISSLNLHQRDKVTILEGYAGTGTLTSELLKLPQVEKVVTLERNQGYNKYLDKLKAMLTHKGQGDRLDIHKHTLYRWSSYNEVIKGGYLANLQNRVLRSDGTYVDFMDDTKDPPGHDDLDWQTLSPLLLIGQLPNTVYGEQLLAQIIISIGGRLWYFRHGRIEMAFVCGEALARRLVAQPGDSSWCKLSATVQCLAETKLHTSVDQLSPHAEHFFPPAMAVGPTSPTGPNIKLGRGKGGSSTNNRLGMAMVTLTPRVHPLIKMEEVDAFEFITRKLFVRNTLSIDEALKGVAPGCSNILKKLGRDDVASGRIRPDELVLPHEQPKHMTSRQFAALTRIFCKWPFRPLVLPDGTDFLQKRRR